MGAATGVVLPFISPMLASRGFSVEEIGLLMAIASLGIVILAPAWGHLGDVVLGRSGALRLTALLATVAVALVAGPTPLLIVGTGLVTWYILQATFPSLLDSIVLRALADRRFDYGSFRLLQSVSFAAVALAAGVLYDRLGYAMSGVLFAIAAAALVLTLRGIHDRPRGRATGRASEPGESAAPVASTATLNLPAAGRPAETAPGTSGRRWSPSFGSVSASLRAAPSLPRVLAVIVMVSFAVLSANTFLPLRLYELGAAPPIIAASATMSAICEVPIMLFGGRLARSLGLRGFFALGCILYAIALGTWIVAEQPLVIVASRVATGLAFGSFTVASVLAIAVVLPDSLQASGQALRQSAVSALAVFGYLGGGLVYGTLGHAMFFLLGVASAVLAAVMAWRWLPARGSARMAETDIVQLEPPF